MQRVFPLAIASTAVVAVATLTVASGLYEPLQAAVLAQRPGRPLGLTRTAWLSYPLLALLPSLLIVSIGLVVPRVPGIVNAPGAETWRTLPLDARRRSAAALQAFFGGFGAWLALLAPCVLWHEYQEALGHTSVIVHLYAALAPLVPLVFGFAVCFPRFEADVAAEQAALARGRTAAPPPRGP